jgi:hypothetical protein
MNSISTTVLGLALLLAGATLAHAKPHNTIKANAVVCVSQAGIEAARPDMNVKQLESLRCINVPTDLRVDVLPPSNSCDSFLHVAATMPDKIMRYWVNRDQLDDYALQLAEAGVTCQERPVPSRPQ